MDAVARGRGKFVHVITVSFRLMSVIFTFANGRQKVRSYGRILYIKTCAFYQRSGRPISGLSLGWLHMRFVMAQK